MAVFVEFGLEAGWISSRSRVSRLLPGKNQWLVVEAETSPSLQRQGSYKNKPMRSRVSKLSEQG